MDGASAKFLEVLSRWEALSNADKRIDGSAYAEILIEIGHEFLDELADLGMYARMRRDIPESE